jgi:hypothetical protein
VVRFIRVAIGLCTKKEEAARFPKNARANKMHTVI